MKTLYKVLVLLTLGVIAVQNTLILNKVTVVKDEVEMEVMKDSTVDLYSMDLTPENFELVCIHYEIEHPEIIYAQAKLESGNFTSQVYKSKNNFLGLYDSRKKDYYSFNHWSDCLKGYKDFVQYKWDGNGDYYSFLKNLPYASDPNYIKKVKYLARS